MTKKLGLFILFIGVFVLGAPRPVLANASADLKKAELAGKAGDFQTAIQLYQKVLAADYKKGKVDLALGDLYASSGDDAEAVKWFSAGLDEKLSRDEKIRANLSLAKVYYRNKDYAKAMEYLHNCLALKPKYEEAHLNLALIYRDMQMYPEANQQMEFLARTKKLKYEYNLTMGQIYESWGIYRKAIIYLGKAIINSPMSEEAHRSLAEVYYKQNDFGKSLGEWKYVASVQPQGMVYRKMALCLYNLKEKEKALASLLEAIKLEPNDYMNYAVGGLVYGSNQEWDKALAQFNRGLEINPASEFCLFGQGYCDLRLRKPNLAQASFQKLAELDSTSWMGELANKELSNIKGVN
jgi:tetratricopeptide (TPR) repeat protein